MPIRKLIAEDHVAEEIAKVMQMAFNAVSAYVALNKIIVSDEVIARKVFDAVTAGERNPNKVAAVIIKTLAAKKA
jgi:hypothetical protein